MTVLRTVHLYGVLGEKYGHQHRFVINTPRDAISALSANFDGFRADFFRFPYYGIICDDEYRNAENCADVANMPFSRDIHLLPMVEGRLGTVLVPFFMWLGASATVATVLSGAVTIGLLYGVSLLFAPKPPDAQDATRDQNYMFSGPDNVIEQGAAVPLIYGRCFVGSVVISSGLEVAEGADSDSGDGQNYSWKSSGSTYDVTFNEPSDDLSLPSNTPPRDSNWWPPNG